MNNDLYQLFKKDPTTKIKAKILKQLKALKDNEFIDNKLYYYNCIVPVRPIVSYSGSPLYNLHKNIGNIMKAFVKDKNKNVKNSATFFNYIRNSPIEDDKKMVSFDVTSLHKDIPIIDMLNIIKDAVNKDDKFTKKTTIPQEKFLDLVNLVLTNTFNYQFYQRTAGAIMGGPAFPSLS